MLLSSLPLSDDCIEMLMFVLYMFNSGSRVSNDDSDSGMEDERSNVALLKLDEWLHFKLDSEVSNVQRSSEYFQELELLMDYGTFKIQMQ